MVIDINSEDTISAISTPLGEGGIGIVRISGKNALKIADEIFVGKNGLTPSQFSSYTVHYGFIREKQCSNDDNGKKEKFVDEVILTVMRSPRSYTKEDIIEINCHSGIVSLRKILELVISKGSRLASPGEFTQRAFLNGRIDLLQAEAVLNVIKAKADRALDAAMDQLQGALSKQINKLRQALIELIAPLEATIDFPDEEIADISGDKLIRALWDIKKAMSALIESAEKGIMLQEGMKVVFAGTPNVGKSSLMNKFVDYERVIVTPISGTTRDVVEEVINIEGYPFKLADTAGIINTKCLITKESVSRSLAFLEKADLVLFVLDRSRKIKKSDILLARQLKNKKVIVLINKIDLVNRIDLRLIKKELPKALFLRISALNGTGFKKLKAEIIKLFTHGKISKNDELLITSMRHKEILQKGYQNILKAITIAENKGYDECLIFEIKQVLSFLGEIAGKNLNEDVLTDIFSRFCIGK